MPTHAGSSARPATPGSAASSGGPSLWLVPIGGPALSPVEIPYCSAKPGGAVMGRHESCDLRLPVSAEQVSRYHVRFLRDGPVVRLVDLNSRWGTFVNGVRAPAEQEVRLAEGDLIRVTPWTFTLSPTPSRRGLQAAEDSGNTMVRQVAPETAQPLAQDMLALLLEGAAAIHASGDEKELAERVIDAAVRGTGLHNAAMLRPVDMNGRYEVIASKLGMHGQTGPSSFSRSLLNAAAGGQVAEVSGALGGNISESMVQMKINAAICVPLTLGGAPAAFLYLDSRGTLPTSLRPNASSFCVALGRIASLALANLKRITMEKREAQFRAELDAAAVAQKWILPKRVSQFGPLAAIGESKPGQFVGGDFFDVVPLDGGKLGVGLGDVSGKGISASVLMTAAQGFFNARVSDDPDIARAVNALNRFVNPRRPANKFVTLWAGVIDPAAGTLRYVDAGHSYALLRRANGTIEQLDVGGGLPIGIDEDAEYQATETTIGPGDAVIVVSDGIIEQFGVTTDASGEREQFGVAKLSAAIAAEPDDPVAELFKAVVAHAGTDKLADDATVVWVKWGPAQTA